MVEYSRKRESMAYTDLNYLRNVTGGEPEIIREMIELFISQIPEFSENLNNYLAEKKYLELGKEAHKAKSSVLVVGMEQLGKDLKTLQLLTLDGKGEETYADYVKEFDKQCNAAVEELKQELDKL